MCAFFWFLLNRYVKMYGSKDVKFTNLTRLLVNGHGSFKQIQPVAAWINKTEGP
jgi:hypothetical protein